MEGHRRRPSEREAISPPAASAAFSYDELKFDRHDNDRFYAPHLGPNWVAPKRGSMHLASILRLNGRIDDRLGNLEMEIGFK
jgi:hypothetical protein